MSRKVLGRIVVCALTLAMVLGLCTMVSLADDSWSAAITSDNASGVIGRTITVKVTGGSDASATYYFKISATNGTVSTSSFSLTSGSSATFTVVTSVDATTGSTAGTITVESNTDGTTTYSSTKNIAFTSYTPELSLSTSSAIYDVNGNSFTVKVKNAAKDGRIVVKPKGTGTVMSINDKSVTVHGVDSYEVLYTAQDGTTKYCPSIMYNVTPQKAVLAVSNQSVTIRVGKTATIDYATTSGNTQITCANSDTAGTTVASATATTTNKTITITAGSTPGTASVTVTDKSGGNYSNSDPVGILVNVIDNNATLINVSPGYVKLDKDTSSKKVNISLENATVDDGVAEVNIKVIKPTGTAYRGVYIDGVRKSAGNTYNIKTTGNAAFDVTLKARYSGSYTLKVTNGATSVNIPVYITGYNTLPQTGPDYSMVYIFAALLTVALGGIVLVNVLRKKDENIK